MYHKTFIDACLNGDALLIELDDYVDFWHEGNTGVTLREFLGLTTFEYSEWLKNDDEIFRDILRCRKSGIPFDVYISAPYETGIAARAYNRKEVEELKNIESKKKSDK